MSATATTQQHSDRWYYVLPKPWPQDAFGPFDTQDAAQHMGDWMAANNTPAIMNDTPYWDADVG